MSRRPRRNRPPRLPDQGNPFVLVEDDGAPPRPATPRAQLIAARVAGPHTRLGRAEMSRLVARMAAGAPETFLGLALERVTRDEAMGALADTWGWDGASARATIDPDRTLAAVAAAAARLDAVASAGGVIAFATGRPASLLPLYEAVAARADARGATVPSCGQAVLDDAPGRALWWHDGVAVVTDGTGLLADAGLEAGPEWLFAVGRPDLVVADRGFAGAAMAAGHETIALADVDSLALGVAAARGLPVLVVPLDDGRPPASYSPVVEGLTSPVDAQEPHSTTPAPDAYAAPQSGGEG